MAGIPSDADVLIDDLRRQAAIYRLQYGSHMPIEQIVTTIADKKQRFTQVRDGDPLRATLG